MKKGRVLSVLAVLALVGVAVFAAGRVGCNGSILLKVGGFRRAIPVVVGERIGDSCHLTITVPPLYRPLLRKLDLGPVGVKIDGRLCMANVDLVVYGGASALFGWPSYAEAFEGETLGTTKDDAAALLSKWLPHVTTDALQGHPEEACPRRLDNVRHLAQELHVRHQFGLVLGQGIGPNDIIIQRPEGGSMPLSRTSDVTTVHDVVVYRFQEGINEEDSRTSTWIKYQKKWRLRVPSWRGHISRVDRSGESFTIVTVASKAPDQH